MSSGRLYKYFDDPKWAIEMLRGRMLFRSLAYFRDHEQLEVRGDKFECTSVFRPDGGLTINNLTQGWTKKVPSSAFLSSAQAENIYVYCLSRSLTPQLQSRFNSVACVEVLDVKKFCARVSAGMPNGATFPGPDNRKRLGHQVEYYDPTQMKDGRWARPDLIAISKTNDFAWQNEFRLVFSLTDAFRFQNAHMRLVIGEESRTTAPLEHASFSIDAGSLSDVCILHELSA